MFGNLGSRSLFKVRELHYFTGSSPPSPSSKKSKSSGSTPAQPTAQQRADAQARAETYYSNVQGAVTQSNTAGNQDIGGQSIQIDGDTMYTVHGQSMPLSRDAITHYQSQGVPVTLSTRQEVAVFERGQASKQMETAKAEAAVQQVLQQQADVARQEALAAEQQRADTERETARLLY